MGRAGQRDLDARLHPASTQDIRRAQGRTQNPPPCTSTRRRLHVASTESPSAPPPTRGESGSPATPTRCPPRHSSEVAEAGYESIELGPYGYLPSDPARAEETTRRARPRACWREPYSPPAPAGRLGLHLEAGDRRGRADPGRGRRAHRGHPRRCGATTRPGSRRRTASLPPSSGSS